MNMEDLKIGSTDENSGNILMPNGGTFMVVPIKMPMNMHMIGAMYAPSNRITLMAMLPYISMKMNHITTNGGSFTTKSSGFGDVKVGAMYKFLNKQRQSLHGQLGFSLPTGTIQNKDKTPASNGNDAILPYPMQIGSGTFDTDLGLTYLGQSDTFSWGSQLKGTFRLGKNDNEYRLGNKYGLNNWFAIKTSKYISFSARVQGLLVDEISGENPDLNPGMIITADTNNSGGEYIYGGLGMNFYLPNGTMKNIRLGLEFSTPLYQNINGTQLKQKETLTFGLQYSL